MKILIWAPFINKVGTTTNVINSIVALKKFSKKNEYSIDLIDVFGEWSEYKFKDIRINKLQLLNNKFIYQSKKDGFLRSRFFTLLIFFYSIIPLAKLLKKNNYDFIMAHLITSLPILLLSFLKIKTKLILCIAGFPKLTFFRSFFWKFFQKSINKIICPSKEAEDLFIKNLIFNRDKLFVIKDPHINIKKIIKKKNSNNDNLIQLPDDFIIAIGRLTIQKNYIFLLNAFKNILKEKNNLNLVIIGDGEDRKKIEKKILELEIKNKVFLLGYQSNIYAYLKKARCYISTSNWEGGPGLATLDAAFLNIPIICSNCRSGRKEFIGNNERGYIFDVNNLSSLLSQFDNFFNENQKELKNKLINSKKEVRNFTLFRYFLGIKKLLG